MEGSAARARHFLRDNLGPGSADLDDMALCVTELVANGVKHTDSGRGGKLMILLAKGRGVIRIEVTDDGAGGARPCPRDDPEAESGRGLRIVEALAMRWGHCADGVRTTVWVEFPGAVVAGRRD
ncbi:ATP-binding protein [Actinomadura sp. HBU206391]|nr:ATP-binding protein [Actinomadura sp. HBU206391]